MSRICKISKKSSFWGNTVSHAHNKRRKVSFANLHQKRLFDSESQKWVRVKVSSRMLRTIDKKGLAAALRDNNMTLEDLKRGPQA